MSTEKLSAAGDLSVPGFVAAAAAAGIRYPGRPDLALIVSQVGASVAGVFTTNKVQAAPVLVSREHLAQGVARAVLLNSGVANACTGAAGLEQARACARLTAAAVGCQSNQVLLASTGVIGRALPMERLASTIPRLATGLRPDGWLEVAQAIMTTDTVPKLQIVKGRLQDRPFSVLGIAKGAGMIAPQMATLLAVVVTDLSVAPETLEILLREETECSLNRIVVDGETSTNDTLFGLASGLAGNSPIEDATSPAAGVLRECLHEVLLALAKKIVADAEGATKFIQVKVIRAAARQEALQAARVVASSPLVKTALFGQDPNWGRILAALGRAGVRLDPERIQLFFDEVKLVENGLSAGDKAEKEAGEILARPAFSIIIDLGQGEAEETVYTCDLSTDYVRINSSYRS